MLSRAVGQFHFLPNVTEMKSIVLPYGEIGENNKYIYISALVGASIGFSLCIKCFICTLLYLLKKYINLLTFC